MSRSLLPRRLRQRSERGASVIELVLYMPLLMTAIFLVVQFSLIYLGNQVASAAAREAARVARVQAMQTGPATAEALAVQEAQELIDHIGDGMLDNADVTVDVAGGQVHAVVSGAAQQLLPFLDPPRVSEQVTGPVERFVPDT